MNIAIDISPLESGHKVRGVGFYLKHLKEALVKYYSDHYYTFFTHKNEIPQKIDVIHYPYFDPFQRTLSVDKRAATVVTVHDLTPIVFPKLFPVGIRGRLNWELQKRTLKNVAGIITDSECSKRDVVQYTGQPEEKITAVYLAAGEEFKIVKGLRVNELTRKYNIPEKFVLYVGDVTPNKNLPRLVEAAREADVPLVMVGKALSEKEYDASHPWNKDLVQVHRLAEGNKNIHILGFLPGDDLISLYNAAALFILPSMYEGFGLPVIEAMAAGCPVITTREGSLAEVAGDAAYFVDALSTDSLVDGLRKVYRDSDLQKELSEKGLKQASKFSWKKTAKATLDAYEKAYTHTS